MIAETVARIGSPVMTAGIGTYLFRANRVQSANRSPVPDQTAALDETHCRNMNAFADPWRETEEDMMGPVLPPLAWMAQPSMPKRVMDVTMMEGTCII